MGKLWLDESTRKHNKRNFTAQTFILQLLQQLQNARQWATSNMTQREMGNLNYTRKRLVNE